MGREEGSGWGTHVYLWWIHLDIWQNQYSIVKFKNKIKFKKIIKLGKKKSFKASSIRTAIAVRFERQERSLPNKGVGHSGTTRNWWENICQQQRSARVNLS